MSIPWMLLWRNGVWYCGAFNRRETVSEASRHFLCHICVAPKKTYGLIEFISLTCRFFFPLTFDSVDCGRLRDNIHPPSTRHLISNCVGWFSSYSVILCSLCRSRGFDLPGALRLTAHDEIARLPTLNIRWLNLYSFPRLASSTNSRESGHSRSTLYGKPWCI